jgi:hypothetical protein
LRSNPGRSRFLLRRRRFWCDAARPGGAIFNGPRPFNFREGCDDADNRRQLPSTAANRRSQTAAFVRQTIWMHLMRLGRRASLDGPRGARERRTLTCERQMTKGVSR